MYMFKCGDVSKNKLKDTSKSNSRNIKIDENKKCWVGGEYQPECDTYLIRSLNNAMYLQRVRKTTPTNFDDKSRYRNETEKKPWN